MIEYTGFSPPSVPRAAKQRLPSVTFVKGRRSLEFNVRAHEALGLGQFEHVKLEQNGRFRHLRFSFHNEPGTPSSLKLSQNLSEGRNPRASIPNSTYLNDPNFAWFAEYVDACEESPSFALISTAGEATWLVCVPEAINADADESPTLTLDEQWAGLTEEEKADLLVKRTSP